MNIPSSVPIHNPPITPHRHATPHYTTLQHTMLHHTTYSHLATLDRTTPWHTIPISHHTAQQSTPSHTTSYCTVSMRLEHLGALGIMGDSAL